MALTFLNELPPPLGPRSQLVAVGLLYLGTFLQAAHEVVAEPVAVIESLDGALVVPHLRTRGEKKTAWRPFTSTKHELPFATKRRGSINTKRVSGAKHASDAFEMWLLAQNKFHYLLTSHISRRHLLGCAGSDGAQM